MALTPAEFAAFFCAIHGHDPFPWQQRLVEQLASNNRWPHVLDLPTGSGKTAALDVAVFHLALQANYPRRRVALRIVLLVDRRLVVDDADRRGAKNRRRLVRPVAVPAGWPRRGRRGRAAAATARRQRRGAVGGGAPGQRCSGCAKRNRVKEASPRRCA